MNKLSALSILILISACNETTQPANKSDADSSVHAGLVKPVPLQNNVKETCFYDPAVVTVTGMICRKPVFTVQNENGTEPDDKIIVIALSKSISVINLPGVDTTTAEDSYESEYNVDTMQLVLPTYHSLDKSLGHTVQLTGTLFHADNGNHYTNVLMTVSKVKDGNDSDVMIYK